MPNDLTNRDAHREGEAPAEPKPGTDLRLRKSVALPSNQESLMIIPKLDLNNEYSINANPTDRISLWPSPFYDDRQDLVVEHGDGRRMLAIYGFTHAQLSNLHDEIGSILKKSEIRYVRTLLAPHHRPINPQLREQSAMANHREGEAPAEPKPGTDPRLRGSVALPHGASMEQPKRRHPAHGIKHVDGQPTILFDTLCLKLRTPILACDEFHFVFRNVAKQATAWLMGRYVIMPDHIHFFAADVDSDIPYENWIRYLKSQITKQFAPGRDATGGRGSCRTETRNRSTAPRERRPPGFRWLTDHWDTRVPASRRTRKSGITFERTPFAKVSFRRPTIGHFKANYSNCDGPNHSPSA